jgi:hypothetical protein
MTGEVYEQWVAGFDVDTLTPKGRIRTDSNALRFVEVVVNGPKTWSLAAVLHPEVSTALDRAQDRAATEIVGWVAAHATTRVGPRGRQALDFLRTLCGLRWVAPLLNRGNASIHTLKRNSTTSPSCMT